MQASSGPSSTPPPDSLPVLNCRGTHYEVGFRIGHTFKTMIQDLLGNWKYFNNVLKIGSTNKGQALIDNSLKLCRAKYPGYVDEIKGMADGSGIDFEKLFILNIDSILCTLENVDSDEIKKIGATGCTTVICNKDEVLLGHTEDAMAEIQDHIYIVSAEILNCSEQDNETSVILEKFTTLCYAGTLMGNTMGYNNHGMIYSVNTIFPTVYTAGTPRSFVTRSLLGASDLPSLMNILKDKGNGIADGFSLNVYFYPKRDDEGHGSWNWSCNCCKSSLCCHKIDNPKRIFYNIEVAPPKLFGQNGDKMSVVDVLEIGPGKAFTHCNRYLRVNMNECNPTALVFSDKRNSAVCHRHAEPECEAHIREILSDQSDYDYPVYNNGKENDEQDYKMSFVRTVATGIFNIKCRTWSVYTNAPTLAQPLHKFVIE